MKTYQTTMAGEAPGAQSAERLAESLADALQTAFDRGGNVVIPSFAVGRSQEILYFLREIKEKGLGYLKRSNAELFRPDSKQLTVLKQELEMDDLD